MPQLRQNIVTGEWVVIAPERAKRPREFVVTAARPDQPVETCPFCTSAPAYQNRVAEYDTDSTYLIPNKFPAFVATGLHEVRSYVPEEGFYQAKPATGGHDVIVVKDHHLSLPKFNQSLMTDLLSTFYRRYQHYHRDPTVEYAMAIYNHGEAAAASISHPHAQIFASSIVPNHILKEKHGSERYYEINGRCVYCEIIDHERQEKIRLLGENDDFTMFTFFAARFPFEIWILPKVHQSTLEQINATQLINLAGLLGQALHLLDRTLSDPALNFFIHSLPMTSDNAAYYHWHLEIAPRVANYGGFEMGSGTIIDIVSPEKAAEFLLTDVQAYLNSSGPSTPTTPPAAVPAAPPIPGSPDQRLAAQTLTIQ